MAAGRRPTDTQLLKGGSSEESVGADAVWVKRFDELSEALEDLVEGVLSTILRPAIPKV